MKQLIQEFNKTIIDTDKTVLVSRLLGLSVAAVAFTTIVAIFFS